MVYSGLKLHKPHAQITREQLKEALMRALKAAKQRSRASRKNVKEEDDADDAY